MDLLHFNSILDSAAPDPRSRIKDEVCGIVLRHRKAAPEFVDELAAPRLRDLGQRIKDLLEHGRAGEIDSLVRAFDVELTNEIVYQRTSENGRLRPVTAESEIKRNTDLWAKHRWTGHHGYELSNLRTLIPDGARIKRIGYWEIELASGAVITRDQVRQVNRPRLTSERAWLSNFVSDATVREAEEREQREARELARPFREFSGPRPVRD